ncbi:hypothetical protein IM40_04020 [Candidatus Paracaedimonas acanthamoebae]|nr:hypothetical protein IM40_04020 [Candidatus Paracaedimonas acanthamoebae]
MSIKPYTTHFLIVRYHAFKTYKKLLETAKLNEEARHLLKQGNMISKEEYLYTIHKEDEDDFGDKIITKEEKHFA